MSDREHQTSPTEEDITAAVESLMSCVPESTVARAFEADGPSSWVTPDDPECDLESEY